MSDLKQYSRHLRNTSTEAEIKLWTRLSRRQLMGLKFRRQVPIENYIVDFLCFEKKLIIELDGGQHNDSDTAERDKERDEILKGNGFLVLRFWNNDVFENIDGVLESITNTLHPHLNPPPQGEEISKDGRELS